MNYQQIFIVHIEKYLILTGDELKDPEKIAVI